MPAGRSIRSVALLAALLGLAGCVSTIIEPAARTDFATARAGDTVQMQWSSQTGMLYTISYSDTMGAGARWQPLPQGIRLRGTGQPMTLSDRVPGGRPRFYDILMEPAAALDATQRSRATKTPNSGR